jgi:hypothetical protein
MRRVRASHLAPSSVAGADFDRGLGGEGALIPVQDAHDGMLRAHIGELRRRDPQAPVSFCGRQPVGPPSVAWAAGATHSAAAATIAKTNEIRQLLTGAA